MPYILAGDWTFVTRNAKDFRGSASEPGRKGQYRGTALHAGLICINGPIGMDIDIQLEAFSAVLDFLDTQRPAPDLTNQVLEATIECDAVILRRHDLPSMGGAAHQDSSVPRRPHRTAGGSPAGAKPGGSSRSRRRDR